MAFWGVEIKPGKPFTLLPDKTRGRLRISQATLGGGSSNNKSSSVQCNVGNKTPVLLCSLLPDKAESIHLELEFEEAEEVTFSVIGPRSVHLTGYVLGKSRQLLVGDDESESYGEDVGDTDTEVSNEIGDEDEDEYEGSFIDDGEPTYSPPSPSSSEEVKKNKKKAKIKGTLKRLQKKYKLSDSEDEIVASHNNHRRNRVHIVESDEDDQKPISSLCGTVKMDLEASKRKKDDVSGKEASDYPSDDGIVMRKKVDNVAEKATDDGLSVDRKLKKRNKHDDVAVQEKDDEIVMRKKVDNVAEKATDDGSSVDRKVKKRKKHDDGAVQEKDDCQSSDRKIKKRKKLDAVSEQATDDCQSDDRKVKKNKRKNKTNESVEDTETPSGVGKNETKSPVAKGGTKTDLCTRTISGGLVIEELEIGEEDGKVASSGRKVTVHYTAKLKQQDRVFYSTVGNSPLKFRLGKDAALDGLHLGIDGMRAGGKRKLVIPPELGYGSEGSDGVPPNAWLIVEVELLKVR